MAAGTAFILVPGLHTGGWVWQDVAGRLREAGAEAYALTLTGMGGENEKGAGAELEAHIADVLRAVDAAQADDVVLVGHCYGVHPVLGAADRRPERVARIVLVDTPMPQDGDTPAALVPAQGLRGELLLRIAEDGPEQGELAPPTDEGWRTFGSFEGLGPAVAAELAGRAVPQPWRTLAQPLELKRAAASGAVPVTGVLCTANGSSLAMVEQVLALGDPRFRYLAAPHMSYLELATGHWPMLSEPAATARLLLRAAAGEGTAARGPSAAEPPVHLRPFLIDVPEHPRERVGRVDLHLPEGDEVPRPAVVFVHGGPVPEGARPTPRDWPAFRGYARLAAELGAVGVTVDHRLHDVADFARAARDVQDAVALVRAHPRVDGDRVALWFLSTGGLLSADWLAAPPPWLRCVALTYPLLAPMPGWGVERRFQPARTVRDAGRLPVVLTRVGRESPEFAATVEDFVAAAGEAGVPVRIVDVPSARHGFETYDDPGDARRAVGEAARAVLAHLSPGPETRG
ncbi:alpha/beta hydrolase [Actinacidiphila bryophytorum]|uniref:Acetyl esterase/lipase n=1 Tax=Actinacidiphila bryophytorum TaxID=1436133 RepID=A0A9W4H4H3_9ACTN|nr:alpha/beta fold hydrolase [Actinacidiphila bryophytorum]MBM9435874.1 alpha/beta fold hydrolase [Actinacidiphila bryophytorum]MBN6544490.1 alpha/beta fold hydrolase [Actinacidiphila bryophytorum]CAG7649785.1 Acetyl esterase/lipase [Actinacidiphila bryophytorum]